MGRRLDDQLQALAAAGGLAPDDLESAVWRRIHREREARSSSSLTLTTRAVAMGAALAIGIAGGGMTAAAVAGQSNDVSAFSIQSDLAPSTLLDGHG